MRCSLCNAQAIEIAHDWYGCDTCGLHFINPQPTSEELSSFYYSESRRFRGNRFLAWLRVAHRYHMIERYLPATCGIMCDVGCSDGSWLRYWSKKGWNTIGVEHDCHIPTMCNVIVYSHSLEHMPCPVREITNSKELLLPNGIIYIEVPLASCVGYDIHSFNTSRHLYNYTESSLRLTVEKAGMNIVAEGHGKWIPFGLNMNYLWIVANKKEDSQ